ncbi:MAG: hypothetical protein HKN47_22065 [Pirellulaceae bacterium]|nr:hypothetical protein [Pirellulaceae bacterium]
MFDYEGSRSEFLRLLAEMGEEPAFIQRGRAPATALHSLMQQCAAERSKQLKWPRRHFTILRRSVCDDWERLAPLVTQSDANSIFEDLAIELTRVETVQRPWFSTDRSLLRAFLESAERFNRSWTQFIDDADLDHINQLRMAYNELYPMEKSCALGTESIDRGFVPLVPLDRSWLTIRFPLLVLPSMA